MTATRDELRDQLVAAIEAAPELPKEDRQHLADVFLDQLTTAYDLVPRGSGTRPQPTGHAGGRPRNGRWLPFALVLTFVVFVLPAMLHHAFPIVLLLGLVVFLAARCGTTGMRRRDPLGR